MIKVIAIAKKFTFKYLREIQQSVTKFIAKSVTILVTPKAASLFEILFNKLRRESDYEVRLLFSNYLHQFWIFVPMKHSPI
jgi:hypothetical protein